MFSRHILGDLPVDPTCGRAQWQTKWTRPGPSASFNSIVTSRDRPDADTRFQHHYSSSRPSQPSNRDPSRDRPH
eukprot:3843818-Rhodomonas_salina.1